MEEDFQNSDEIEVIYLDDDEEIATVDDDALETDNKDDFQGPDVSYSTFNQHKRAVFTSALSKDGRYAVTGGEDDIAFIWSTLNGEIYMECTGHNDSITAVGFNHDENYLATGDMSGMVQVWDLKEKKLVWCYEGDDLEWMSWHHLANVLLVGSHSGDVYIWQIPQGHCKVLPSPGSACTSGKLHPDGKRLVAGYDDGQVKMWDIKTMSVEWSYAHASPGVTSLEMNPAGTLVSVAPHASILKTSDGKLTASLLLETETEIEAHCFDAESNVFVSGSLTGQLCVWDLSKHSIRHQARINSAVTLLSLGTNGRIFIGGTDGVIYVCDLRTGSLLDTLTGHTEDILSLSVSQSAGVLLSTSDDSTAKLFKV